jgi:plastocyanin
MRLLLLLLALCPLWWGAAAPASPPAAPAASAGDRAEVVRVVMKRNRFRPRRVVVRLGDTVSWRNRDPRIHTVVSQDLGFDSDVVRPRKTFRYRTRRRGTFDYFCTIHIGQEGVLVVR